MTEVAVGTPALVVVSNYSSKECYDMLVSSVSKTGQIAVSYVARGGYHVTKRFYKRKYSGTYDELGGRTAYSRPYISIYFGDDIAPIRAEVLAFREKQDIWEALNVALRNMPGSCDKSVPKSTDIADVRQRLAEVISALNRAEHYNNKQALEQASA